MSKILCDSEPRCPWYESQASRWGTSVVNHWCYYDDTAGRLMRQEYCGIPPRACRHHPAYREEQR